MVKELLKIRRKELSFNIVQSSIESVKKLDITKSACRVYQDGVIGIAGTLGDETQDTWNRAQANLSLELPWMGEPEKDKKRYRDCRREIPTAGEFMKKTEALLNALRTEFPDFSFSNKINLVETIARLANDRGLELEDRDAFAQLVLLIKDKASANVMDDGVVLETRNMDFEPFHEMVRSQISVYHTPADVPEGEKIPVIFCFNDIGQQFMTELSGESIGKKTSIFTEKLGKKVFHESFTLLLDRRAENVGCPFFDDEGSTLENDMLPLIDHGVITRPYCGKKDAAAYGYLPTASGEGDYDGVPRTNPGSAMQIMPGEKTLRELLGGRKAIFVTLISGGDYTNEGDYASPVQCSYLYEDGRLTGRLPQIGISGNLYEMFGDGFIGCSRDKAIYGTNAVVLELKISREI